MRIILEMANNHQGSVVHGKRIIKEHSELIEQFPEFEFTIKFQLRELQKIIHKDYAKDTRFPYMQKFVEKHMYLDALKELKQYAEKMGFSTLCTPFDEYSVEHVYDMGFKEIKIASCSSNDWPLLNAIADTGLPVIISTGGKSLSDVDKSVLFFKNRDIDFSIMHCIALYPTLINEMNLNMIDLYKLHYGSDVQIGLSTHEQPGYTIIGALAASKGISMLEKHVDVEHDNKNRYSATPKQMIDYLENVYDAILCCGTQFPPRASEQSKLLTFTRAAYLKKDVKVGERFDRNDLYFCMPVVGRNHVTVDECSKYNYYIAEKPIKADEPLLRNNVATYNVRDVVLSIVEKVNEALKLANVYIPRPYKMEVSTHYGLKSFSSFGMCMITLVNNAEYCKKVLLLQKGQENPKHKHNKKKETFFVIKGVLKVNGKLLHRGESITIQPGEWHSLYAPYEDVVLEEISTNHDPNDSIYENENINRNKNRKMTVYV